MTTKLKPITDTSWLVIGDTEDIKIGLLTQVRNEYILMVKGQKQKFLDRKSVNQFFSENVFENVVESSTESGGKKSNYIDGYPVDFDNPHEVSIKGVNLPLYSKKADSEVYFAAGYYCLKFPKNWMGGLCPKLSTLNAYEYAGPFKTDIEMKSALTRLRKERNKK